MTLYALTTNEGFRFGEQTMLWLIWLAPMLLLFGVGAALLARRASRRFVDSTLYQRLAPPALLARRIAGALLMSGAALLVALALARPQTDPKLTPIQRSGRDVCFVLDISRSMLAEDVAPNRIDRAKMWISDALSVAGADRVGLVVFAGDSKPLCPLTRDHAFFRLTLQEAGPESVNRGGTMIGDALRLVMHEVFRIDPEAPESERFRDVILITDGEDHGSFPVEASAALGKAGVRLIIIGIGSEDGSLIRLPGQVGADELVRNSDGEPVVTRLDSETLRQMALATPDGRYFPVADATIRLDDVYRQLVRQSEQNRPEEEERFVYEERFQIFILAAVTLLFIHPMLSIRRRRT